MSLPLSRYNFIRERLLFLFNILNNRLYTVFVTPKMLMSIEELRDRPEYTQEGFVNDPGQYDEYQERLFKIPQIIDFLPNLVSEDELAFREPNHNIVEIYESIQEYLQLWCELYSKAPEFPLPPMDELRNLELMAYTIFTKYRSIKSFLNNRKFTTTLIDEKAAEKANLMGLAALFGMSGLGAEEKSGINWISHLDGIQPGEYGGGGFGDHPILTHKAVADSLASPESVHNLGEWTFKGGR